MTNEEQEALRVRLHKADTLRTKLQSLNERIRNIESSSVFCLYKGRPMCLATYDGRLDVNHGIDVGIAQTEIANLFLVVRNQILETLRKERLQYQQELDAV